MPSKLSKLLQRRWDDRVDSRPGTVVCDRHVLGGPDRESSARAALEGSGFIEQPDGTWLTDWKSAPVEATLRPLNAGDAYEASDGLHEVDGPRLEITFRWQNIRAEKPIMVDVASVSAEDAKRRVEHNYARMGFAVTPGRTYAKSAPKFMHLAKLIGYPAGTSVDDVKGVHHAGGHETCVTQVYTITK